MFGLMGVARLSGQPNAFSLLSLFRNGEQGAIYEPWDFSTLFQDSAGTTPVTAVEQPVGKINDKSGNGNHATQATAAARPVVSARVNLLTYSEDLSNAAWAKLAGATITGTNLLNLPSEGDSAYNLCVFPPNTFAKVQLRLSGSGTVSLNLFDAGYSSLIQVTLTATPTVYTHDMLSHPTCTHMFIQIIRAVGDTATSVTVTDVQMETGSTATRYQRVTTATDYDTVGFPHYLVFDGIDDCLTTAAIDFTGTSKATQFIGRHSAGSTTQMVYELGPNVQNMFGQLIDGGSVTYAYARGDSGFAFPYAVADTKINQIVTQATDVTSATSIGASTVRINGAAQTLVDGGTAPGGGTLGNLALYIGSRTGSTLFFNGRMYGLVIRGAESSATEIENTEAYIASKAGVTL